MHRIFGSWQSARLAITCILAYIVMMRKLLASLLGGWLVIGLISWCCLGLAYGQPIGAMFFSIGYASATLLLVAVAWKLVRSLRKLSVRRPQPKLQPAN
jgi:hypothetical protein